MPSPPQLSPDEENVPEPVPPQPPDTGPGAPSPVPREDDRPAPLPVKLPGQPHAPERVSGPRVVTRA